MVGPAHPEQSEKWRYPTSNSMLMSRAARTVTMADRWGRRWVAGEQCRHISEHATHSHRRSLAAACDSMLSETSARTARLLFPLVRELQLEAAAAYEDQALLEAALLAESSPQVGREAVQPSRAGTMNADEWGEAPRCRVGVGNSAREKMAWRFVRKLVHRT